MLERVYDTLKGILFSTLPKNSDNKVVIYDRPITLWITGGQQIVPGMAGVMFKGSSSSPTPVANGIMEVEHTIKIVLLTGNDTQETSERVAQEMARQVYAALKDHRFIWVNELCPICSKFMLSPQHYTIEHGSIFSSYVTAATTDWGTLWAETHSSSAPTLGAPELAAEAFRRVYEDVRANTSVSGLSNTAKNNILKMQADLLEPPIRFLYDAHCKALESSDDGEGKGLLHKGELTFSAKELIRQAAYGPNNVPTTAY